METILNTNERVAALEAEIEQQHRFNALALETLVKIRTTVDRHGAWLVLRGVDRDGE